MNIREWQQAVHKLACLKEWHQSDPLENVWKFLGNIHAEVSEAWEEARMPEFDPTAVRFGEDGKPEGFGIEMADVVIRVMDTCEALGVDLETMIEEKHRFNETRPHRHRGKRA